jgi:hypothetical protein
MSVAETWGTDAAERGLPFPCDRYLDQPDGVYFRGVTIRAGAPAIFRWPCQMRVAPYSYDWIDNGGRRSPRTLTPGMDALAVGQSMMRIFSLVDFAPDRRVTVQLDGVAGTPSSLHYANEAVFTWAPFPEAPTVLPLVRGVRGGTPHRSGLWPIAAPARIST